MFAKVSKERYSEGSSRGHENHSLVGINVRNTFGDAFRLEDLDLNLAGRSRIISEELVHLLAKCSGDLVDSKHSGVQERKTRFRKYLFTVPQNVTCCGWN